MQAYSKFCHRLKANHLFRQLQTYDAKQNSVDFTHNDYLGLSQHSKVIAAAQTACQHGVGARAARIVHSTHWQIELETLLAQCKNQTNALLFNCGFVTNAAVIAALLDAKVLQAPVQVFSDKLIHASMHTGCFLAKARQHRFRHNDFDHLHALLKKYAKSNCANFILIESVYGMEGDIADLQTICMLAKQFKALVYVDEAHAFGMFGKHGYGLSQDFPVDVAMGTLSKAIGCQGGFVAAKQEITDYLINAAKGFIYSTGLTPVMTQAARAAIELLPTLDATREKILALSHHLRSGVQSLGFNTGTSNTHIVPLIVGCEKTAEQIQVKLLQAGVIAAMIRPPTVPVHSARIRFAINASHTQSDIDTVLSVLRS